MQEKLVERKLIEAVKRVGGLCPKFISPGLDGVPDRIVLLPNGHMGFVEIKTTGEKMRPLQVRRKSQLERLGFLVYCMDRFSPGQAECADGVLLQGTPQSGRYHIRQNIGHHHLYEVYG